MRSFVVREIEGVTESGPRTVRKVVRDDRCYFDVFCQMATKAGLSREITTCIRLLDDLARSLDLPPGKFKWLRDHPTTGPCEHDGEFELRIKQLRCYGVLENDVLYLMFGGHIKKSRGTKKQKTTSNQNDEIKRFLRLVRGTIKIRGLVYHRHSTNALSRGE